MQEFQLDHLNIIIALSSSGYAMKEKGSKLQGKLKTGLQSIVLHHTGPLVKVLVRIVNSIFHSSQWRPGTILSIVLPL